MAIAIDHSQKYSYADYLNWSDDERWEIISGFPYNMSPAPTRRHQYISGVLFSAFFNLLKGRPCQVYAAPFDVRLSEDMSDDHLIENVVQPDLSVFCDKSKLDDKGAIGAPDLVVEILSPSTASKDMKTKLLLYQKFGVKEYWLVDPEKKTVERFNLDRQGKYNPGMVFQENKVKSELFADFQIPLDELFAD